MSVVLTKSRALNALRCYWNYALSYFGLVRITHMPVFISVEPAAVCQLRCPACPVGREKTAALTEHRPATPDRAQNTDRLRLTEHRPPSADRIQTELHREQTYMSLEVFRRVLEECKKTAWVMQFYFQGEPLLNSELATMISEAHEAGLYTIVSTNAQAMTEQMAEDLVNAGLDRIIISMDGLSQESYSAYRIGGDIEKCKAALRWLRKAKESNGKSREPIVIELQCLRLKSNEAEWEELKKVYKSLGADKLSLKTAQLYDYSDGHELMPTDERYSRYIKGSDGKYRRRPLGKGCRRVWSGAVITTTGEVLPCCYDKARAYAYGNIMETPLKELYRNEKALDFRRNAIKERYDICRECWK